MDFNYLLQLLKLLDPTVKLDQKNKKLYNEFINLNSFIEDYYKNTRNKTSIVNKIASDAELISEALISVSFVIVFLVAVLNVVYKIDKN